MTTKEIKVKKPKVLKTGAEKVVKVSKPKISKIAPLARAGLKKESAEGRIVLRIRVRAYESKILDSSVKQIMDTAVRYDAEIIGPVPLPTEKKKYTVNRSTFVHKNARDQYEMRVHKRLIDILNPGQKTIDALMSLNLPAGVDIEIKM